MFSSSSLSWGHVIAFFIVVIALAYLAERSKSKVVTGILLVFLILVSGLRHGYVDTREYRNWFETTDPSAVLNLNYIFNGTDKDRGFNVLLGILRLFTDDGQVFLFLMALVTVSCLFYGIIKNAPEMTIAVFLFITAGCYLDTMNGLRQALVSAVLFACLPQLIEKKKFFKYLIIVLVASTVHASALLFIPIYFIADKKVGSIWTWGIVIVSFAVFVFFNSGIGGFIVEILEETSYGEDYSDMLLSGNTSVNIIRPAVALVPLILPVFCRQDVKSQKNTTMYRICYNMSIINFIVWIFATKVLYFYRLAMYFQPYMILLLCYELHYLTKDNKKIILPMAIILFIIWHAYSLYSMGDHFFVGFLKY